MKPFRGLSLLEAVLAVGLLGVLILGALGLQQVAMAQQGKAKALLTAGWLARGAISTALRRTMLAEQASLTFPPPFDAYRGAVSHDAIPGDRVLERVRVIVHGPHQVRVTLEGLRLKTASGATLSPATPP